MDLPFLTYTEIQLLQQWLQWYSFALDCGYSEHAARKAATRQMRILYGKITI